MYRYNDPENVIVSITDSLTSSDLAFKNLSYYEIPTTPGWVEFDFTDINVTPNATYYIVVRTPETSMSKFYLWGYSTMDMYPFGDRWYSMNNGLSWFMSFGDSTFRTYGYNL
jgi:hypothetical protein